MARHECIVLNKTFPSKTKLKAHVKELLQSLQGKTLTQGDEYDFLMALFDRHPEKERKKLHEVRSIFIRKGFAGSDVILNYGTTQDNISWNFCIDQNEKKHKAIWFRELIADQIEAFRKSASTCLNCEARENLEVDHEITFKSLVERFEQEIKDISKWPRFHQENAKLRILCKECHLKLGER